MTDAAANERALGVGDLVDAHVHLDDGAFDADRRATLARAAAAGVTACFVPAVAPDGWERLRQLAATPGPVSWYIGVGVHPFAARDHDTTTDELTAAAARLRASAIGECGLDKRLVAAGLPMGRQRALLDRHLAAAKDAALPLVLHVVGAHGALLDALRPGAPWRGVVHGFSGAPTLAAEYLRLGLHLGVGPLLLRPGARKLREAVQCAPLERLVLETDGPGPDGANPIEPARVVDVAHELGRLRGVPAAAVAATTTGAARNLLLNRPPWISR